MPYIKQEQREAIRPGLDEASKSINTEGDLNYAFTILAHRYLEKHGLCYRTLNDIGGAFNYADKEFNRRVVGPYEDLKIKANGDIMPNLE